MYRISSLEAKLDAFLTKLNHQCKREPTMGEMAYMQAHDPMCVDQVFQVEDANFVTSRGYVFKPNNRLPTHYNPGLRNHENFSYGNQGNMEQAPQHFNTNNAPPEFQNQGGSSSNYLG